MPKYVLALAVAAVGVALAGPERARGLGLDFWNLGELTASQKAEEARAVHGTHLTPARRVVWLRAPPGLA